MRTLSSLPAVVATVPVAGGMAAGAETEVSASVSFRYLKAFGLLLIGLLLWLVLWAHRRGHSLGAPAHRQGAAGTVGGVGSSEGGGGGNGGGGGDAG